MKKLLFVSALGILFVCCNDRKHGPGGGGNRVPYLPDSTDTPWANTLLDTMTAKSYVATLDSLFKAENISTHAFMINANALLHAITDSPQIDKVIFYLGKDTGNKLTLMYLPARYEPGSGRISDYNEILFEDRVFDQSVPCPTCITLKGPMQPLKRDK